MDVAKAIASCPTIRAAARIAEGLREAMEIERKGSMNNFLENLIKSAEQKER